jgi:hypothetical protein
MTQSESTLPLRFYTHHGDHSERSICYEDKVVLNCGLERELYTELDRHADQHGHIKDIDPDLSQLDPIDKEAE